MTQTGKLTLRQAAETVECSTATVSKALKNGALSGEKLEDGSFSIDPAELMRWNETRSQRGKRSPTKTGVNTQENAPENSPLHVALDALRDELARSRADTAEERQRLLDQIADYRERLDRAEARADRLLPAPEQAATSPKKPRGLLRRLFG